MSKSNNTSNLVNNVDLNKIAHTIEAGKSNKSSLRKLITLEGEWNFDSTKDYQFKTELSYEKGKQVIEIDSPSYLGGNGNKLGPMGYCIAGITSCFIDTFTTLAARERIVLTKLKANADCTINFAKTFDISNEPITEEINFKIEAESDNADKQRLRQLLDMAVEKCPAMYSMLHEVRVNLEI